MIISRAIRLFKAGANITKQKRSSNITQIRNSGHGVTYREAADPPMSEKIVAEFIGGIMWWWILWHCWHDWSHIVGHFPYPDASVWTDEELGIPSDDID